MHLGNQETCLNGDHNLRLTALIFCRNKGLYGADALDEDFSFSDVYNPVNFESARGYVQEFLDLEFRPNFDKNNGSY